MRLAFHAIVAVLSLSVGLSSASAETVVQNDSLENEFDGTSSTARLIDGEMYEAVFEIPEEWLPVEMLGVRVVMVKSNQAEDPDCPAPCQNACGRFGLEVWEEGANPVMNDSCIIDTVRYKDPGTLIFTQDSVIDPQTQTALGFEVRGDDTRGTATFKDLRFDTLNMTQGVTINPIMLNSTQIRVGVRAMDLQCTAGGQITTGDHYPLLISDRDGVGRTLSNFIYGEPLAFGQNICSSGMEQHYAWEDFAPAFQNSTPGDFIMRLILNRDDPVDPPDMGGGMDMGSDMGMADMGGGSDMGGGAVDMGSGASDMGSGGNNANNNNNGENNGTGGALAITSVTPDSADNTSSTEIAVVGSGFAAGAEVLLDARKIGVTETQSGRILATVPEGLAVGLYDVVVTNPDGDTAILMDGFEVTEPGGSDNRGVGDGGCCAQAPARDADQAPGALVGLLLGFAAVVRRRNR